MRCAVDFHNKPRPDTGKIGNVRSDRVLTPKPRFVESGRAQIAPQNRLGMAHLCSELFSELLRAQFVFAKLARHFDCEKRDPRNFSRSSLCGDRAPSVPPSRVALRS